MNRRRLFEKRLSLFLVAMLTLLSVKMSASMRLDGQAPRFATLAQQADERDGSQQASPAQKEAGAPESAPASSSSSDQTPPSGNQSAQNPSPPQAPQPSNQTPAPQTPTPLGTAAAPETRRDGVPGAAPAGAAIAPAKQKRIWRFSVRTALLVGAIVAVGIVAGVSLASPSRP